MLVDRAKNNDLEGVIKTYIFVTPVRFFIDSDQTDEDLFFCLHLSRNQVRLFLTERFYLKKMLAFIVTTALFIFVL